MNLFLMNSLVVLFIAGCRSGAFRHQEQGCCEFVLGLLESQGILCDPKTGRKLLLGQKYSQINLLLKQAGGCEKLKIKIC